MAVISVALLNRSGKPANYIVADDSGLTGVGATGRAIADQRMRLAESSPRRIGGIPADAEGWVKVALRNTQERTSVDTSWGDDRTRKDVAAELEEKLGGQ